MEPDEKNKDKGAEGQESAGKADDQQAPADALSRTPEDLEEEAKQTEEAAGTGKTDELPEKKLSPVKRFFRKVNIYFLIFVLVVVGAGIFMLVTYLNSTKDPTVPNIASQPLTEDALKELANTNVSVGDVSQTLTIQGNAIIAGQTLMRGNLSVAGNIQTGGTITVPKLTVSGDTNLGATQINSLQVATNVAIQGTTTMRDLNVAGATSFSGTVTASQITVSKLIMSGNAVLEIPNHISFTGSSPNRSITSSALLGSGGSISVSGSDTTGTITINTGNAPSIASGNCFARITFQQVFTNRPHVIVSPFSVTAGKLQYYVDRDNTGFSICTINAPDANKQFGFDYFVTN